MSGLRPRQLLAVSIISFSYFWSIYDIHGFLHPDERCAIHLKETYPSRYDKSMLMLRFSVSNSLIVCRETPASSASVPWLISKPGRMVFANQFSGCVGLRFLLLRITVCMVSDSPRIVVHVPAVGRNVIRQLPVTRIAHSPALCPFSACDRYPRHIDTLYRCCSVPTHPTGE